MVFNDTNDGENDAMTLVADRRLNEGEMRTVLDAWINVTRRSQINYLKLSCLQRSQNYDYNMCSCAKWKLKTSESDSNSYDTTNSTKTAAAYEVVDSDMLCENQTIEKLTADMFDGFDGVKVFELTMTAVPNLDVNCLIGLTNVQLVRLSHVFLSSKSLSNKPLCTLWRTLKAVNFDNVTHDAADQNAVLQLIACNNNHPAQTARSNETEKQNNEVNRLLDVDAIEILRCNVSRLTDGTFSGIV
jgi:hypothetical protein